MKSARWCILVAFVVGCQSSAIGTVRRMQKHACAGDAAAFFSFFDRDKFATNVIALADGFARRTVAKDNTLENQEAYQEQLKTEDVRVRAMVAQAFSEWETDIQRRDAGDFCRMSVIGSTEGKDESSVHVATPTGRDKKWVLARSSGGWRVVKICGGEGCDEVLPAPASVDRASVDVVLARVENAMRLTRSKGNGGLSALLANYEVAINDLRAASQQLFPRPPSGLPDVIARDVSMKLDGLASAFRASINCTTRIAAEEESCDEATAEISGSSRALGAILPGLAAYGSAPIADEMHRLGADTSTGK